MLAATPLASFGEAYLPLPSGKPFGETPHDLIRPSATTPTTRRHAHRLLHAWRPSAPLTVLGGGRHGDVRRHRGHRCAAVVPHPGRRARAVRGRLRRDEPVRRQRGCLLLVPGPRARRRRGPWPGLSSRSISYNAHADRPLRAVRRRARRLRQPDDGVDAAVVGVGRSPRCIIVGLLGVRRVDLNARVLAVLLVLECIAVVLYDIGAFGHPAAGDADLAAALSPSSLFVPGVARSSRSASPRSSASSRARSTARRSATRGSRWPGRRSSPSGSPGCSTRVSSWAMIVTVGPPTMQKQTARERARRGVRGLWPSTGATASRRSPTCCSSPACSPRC